MCMTRAILPCQVGGGGKGKEVLFLFKHERGYVADAITRDCEA